MAREVRITVDDDEVFERMKRRKRELDLSWEDVLHRGLWAETDRGAHDWRHYSEQYATGTPGDEFGDRLERQIKQRVEDSLSRAFGFEEAHREPTPPQESGYEAQVESLASAEDAVLVFPFLPDDASYSVPLRVELEMGAGEVSVEVVTVRQGKSVEEMNSFDRSARKRIAEEMATGTPVVLELGGGAEQYQVTPVLTWSRDDLDEPIVAHVEIQDVLLGE